VIDESFLNRAAPPGSMRYFSLLYAPADKRDAIAALYVIDAEIRESARSASHDVAHTRLQWWRAEVDRLVNGAPQHPATRLLFERHPAQRRSFARLHELLVAADMDLARMTYNNASELNAYCSRSGGAVHELIAEQLGGTGISDVSRTFAHTLGVGVRQTEILRDVRQDVRDGLIYLPLDVLEQHGVVPGTLDTMEISENARSALRTFAASVRTRLQTPTRDSDSAALRPILVLAALHVRLLDRIAKRNYDVASRIDLGPVEKPWVAWRAARRAH
jgi:phytoene synthase